MSVIAWTIGGGSVMFIIGLISAIESRRQHKIRSIEAHAPIEEMPISIQYVRVPVEPKNEAPKTAMSMASEGAGNANLSAFNRNAEENLASVGNYSR